MPKTGTLTKMPMLTKSDPFNQVFDGIGKMWQHRAERSAKGILKSFTQGLPAGDVYVEFEVNPDSSLMPESTWNSLEHFLSQMQLMDEPVVAKVDLSRYPHTCPRCGCHAFVGVTAAVDCYNVDCVTKKR